MSGNSNHSDCYDDWEAAEDAGLDPIPIPGLLTEQARNQQLWSEANRGERVEIVHSNTERTHYVPERKILKRPKESEKKRETSQVMPNQTIDERQKNYEAARRRIFGEDTSDNASLKDSQTDTATTSKSPIILANTTNK
ncbi:hypothetical protein BDF22DRAFT_688637 [Syncephalis plumigaleata]|nr:hypothetical protein BDF22DRAFT_688637 [Syncephalis plumigaleata]